MELAILLRRLPGWTLRRGRNVFLSVVIYLTYPICWLRRFAIAWQRSESILPRVNRRPEMGQCISCSEDDCCCFGQSHAERTSLLSQVGKRNKNGCCPCAKHPFSKCRKDCYGPVCAENLELKKKVHDLTEQLKAEKERVDILNASKFHQATGHSLENPNDKNAPSRIAKKFQNIFDEKWPNVLGAIIDGGSSEADAVKLLSSLLQECHRFCVVEANERGDGVQEYESDMEKEVMLKNKWQSDHRLTPFEKYFKDRQHEGTWWEYLDECTACFWQMAIAKPPIELEFLGRGDGFSSEHFDTYASQDDVFDQEIPPGSVVCTVWPATVTDGGKQRYTKGTVLVSVGPPNEPSELSGSEQSISITLEHLDSEKWQQSSDDIVEGPQNDQNDA